MRPMLPKTLPCSRAKYPHNEHVAINKKEKNNYALNMLNDYFSILFPCQLNDDAYSVELIGCLQWLSNPSGDSKEIGSPIHGVIPLHSVYRNWKVTVMCDRVH